MKEELYRTSSEVWLLHYLKKEKATPEHSDFISFSEKKEIQPFIRGGKTFIIFDKKKLKNLGAEKVDYNNLKNNEELCEYVSGYTGEEDYLSDMGYESNKEALEDRELSWAIYLEDFMKEEEWIIKGEIPFQRDLIKRVEFYDFAIDKELLKLLKEKKIPYVIKKKLKGGLLFSKTFIIKTEVTALEDSERKK